ncbi:flagellar hook protein [Cryobacterium zongtaii]|uniref:Flagellar hook protein FlgE n=1 Tax=Cryobacterium zongtaii TaxID=1259217 RepID=A0A2S3Z7F3_9MICO|nr:flagellar hook protein FlgE [Cryobacterium zongtaii]POH61467.1 flagellar hook protein [Cryobacterium zongtaii]
MLRSLYSGISGLRAHQTMLDVTGNNIANVNTTAFKGSATQFQDTLSQLTQGAGGPGAATGGTNPAQVGLGVQVAGIATNFAQGSSQATGKASDMLISGDGFFLTQQGGETIYSRAGSFDFDSAGRLVTPSGAIVQGWGAVDGVVNEGGAVGDLSLPLNAVIAGDRTSKVSMTGTLPSDAVVGTELVRDIKVYDASGAARTLSLTFTKAANGWTVGGVDGTSSGSTALAFTSNGVSSGGTLDIGDITTTGIRIDLSTLTALAGISTVTASSQDGTAPGSLESYSFGKDGTLIGLFSNGEQKALGRIALATFTNPGGLEKTGSNGYRATFNSGTAELGAPGSAGLGSLTGGALEMSNVDLSQEFTNLIVAQRGFQANARIITTSDEVLQELTNLKR